jgi:hypothetical protein
MTTSAIGPSGREVAGQRLIEFLDTALAAKVLAVK